jgi:hypothetical protein
MTHSHPRLLGWAITAVLTIGGPAAALAAPANPTRASLQGVTFTVGSQVESWALNKGRRSLSTIHMPELSGQAAKDYQGHDEFAVVELTLARRFPIYRPGDINAKPTGGTRQISYKLVPGEASWQLKPMRVDTY